MKKLLTSPFYNISKKPYSHKSAQAYMYADMIGAEIDHGQIEDYNEYDELWFYHGNDFFGSLNLFGGVKKFGGVNKLVDISKFNGKVFSLNIEFPDYANMIKDRLKGDYPEIWDKIDLNKFFEWRSSSKKIIHPKKTDKIVIGDSHSICMYRDGWMVNSVPFKTCNGAIKEGFDHFLPDNKFDIIELYFGNIDIRHHLCRLDGDSCKNAEELAKKYVKNSINLNSNLVKIYEPLLIENESRVIPKSGYYKGQPFWGSWEERNQVRKVFRDTIAEETENLDNVSIKYWVNYLKNNKGELDFKHMEKPRSVHLARASYPYWSGEEETTNNLENFFR